MDDGDSGGEVLMTFDLPEISEKLNISEILTFLTLDIQDTYNI